MDKDPKKPKLCIQKSTCNALCIGLMTVLGLVFIGVGVHILLFFKDTVDSVIKSKLPLRQDGEVTTAWLNPPVKPLLQLYLFNVTNPKGFLDGEKPKLQEVGPFVYEEIWTKQNVSWHDNGAEVEYAPAKTFFFREDKSVGPEDMKLTVLNIPMISALASLKYSDLLVRMALGSMLEILKQEPFDRLSVKELMWGYDHPLVKLAKDVLPPERRFPFDDFGFFVGRNGTASGLLRARTGIRDIMELGRLQSFNGKSKLTFWKDDECNAITGTDGSIFHPNVLQNETLFIFNRDLCQSLPLVFDQEVTSSGLPGYRFVPPSNVFNYSANPRNDCFCMADEGCSNFPAGLFNMSACQFGSPVAMSWPHFYQADRILLDQVEGLNPIKEKHQFYIDIQPKLGTGLRAAAKSQINLMMAESPGVKQAEGLRDMVFPVLWFSEGIESIDDDSTVSLLKTAIFLPDKIRSALYPTCFAVGALLLLLVVLCLGHRLFINRDREVFHIKTGNVTYDSQRVAVRTVNGGSSSPPASASPPAQFTKRAQN